MCNDPEKQKNTSETKVEYRIKLNCVSKIQPISKRVSTENYFIMIIFDIT